MNCFKVILLLIFVTCFSTESYSQFTIEKDKSRQFETRMNKDSVKVKAITNDYFSKAKWEAQRLKIRHDRNYVEFTPKMSFNPVFAEYWSAGGTNSFTGFVHLYFLHRYTRDRLSIQYSLDAKYGLNEVDGDVYKNLDIFNLNTKTEWKIKGRWSYELTSNIRSQFTKSDASRTDTRMVSNFMSPAFIDIGGGFGYGKHPETAFTVSILPLAGRIIVVASDTLSKQGAYGVEKDTHTKTSLGSSIGVSFDKKFAKNKLRFRSNIYAFTNIETSHNARWVNTLDFDFTKFLSATLFLEMFYDNLAVTPKNTVIAYYSSMTVAVAYKFTNK